MERVLMELLESYTPDENNELSLSNSIDVTGLSENDRQSVLDVLAGNASAEDAPEHLTQLVANIKQPIQGSGVIRYGQPTPPEPRYFRHIHDHGPGHGDCVLVEIDTEGNEV
jgi:hypothetical protein